jgi:hypothetical protein
MRAMRNNASAGSPLALAEHPTRGRHSRRRSHTARQARWRQRQRDGKAVYSVEVGHEVLSLLIEFNWLLDRDAEDRDAVGRALSAFLEDCAADSDTRLHGRPPTHGSNGL